MAAVPLKELVKGEEYKIVKISNESNKTHGRFVSRTGSFAAFTHTRKTNTKTPVAFNSRQYRFYPSAQMRLMNTISRQKKLPREIQDTMKKYGGATRRAKRRN